VDENGWEGILISSQVKLRLEGNSNTVLLGLEFIVKQEQ
jgi:hypothetical protein